MFSFEKQNLFSKDFLYSISRYIDDIFLTSNEPLESINAMLNEVNSSHPNIKLTRQIGKSLPFLDVLIENKSGILTTSVVSVSDDSL